MRMKSRTRSGRSNLMSLNMAVWVSEGFIEAPKLKILIRWREKYGLRQLWDWKWILWDNKWCHHYKVPNCWTGRDILEKDFEGSKRRRFGILYIVFSFKKNLYGSIRKINHDESNVLQTMWSVGRKLFLFQKSNWKGLFKSMFMEVMISSMNFSKTLLKTLRRLRRSIRFLPMSGC